MTPGRKLSKATLLPALVATLALGVWAVGCGSAGSNGQPPPDVTDPLSAPETATACAELDCLASADCTLRQAEDDSYFCADPASACEQGFVQRSATAEACPEGCVFEPAVCYCPPDLTCVCGGGPPAQCLAAAS